MKKFDIVIIGAGIVGLATALKIKEKAPGKTVAILEKENDIALHQTGNNSGVIHAGLYYKPGSQKALNCTRGYKMLIDFCNKYNIAYDLCGKLVVAANSNQLPRLDELYNRALKNGLKEVKKIKGEEIPDYEPHAKGVEALYVPYTGIIDYKEVAKSIAQQFTDKYQGEILVNHPVESIHKKDGSTIVQTKNTGIETTLVVNAAGLYADRVAHLTGSNTDIRVIPFRGEYYVLKAESKHLVTNLIYPVPDPQFPFLGVHFTRTIAGGVEAGPNAVWAFAREGYSKTSFRWNDFFESLAWPGFRKVMKAYWRMGIGEYYRSFNKNAFVRALQKLVPEITASDIVAGGAGVRAQACSRDGGLVDDFLIDQNEIAVNVLNAPSPAATSCLSIGDTISDIVLKRF